MNTFLVGITVFFLLIILVIFTREKMDYVGYSLLFALIAALLTAFLVPIEDGLSYVPWLDQDAGPAVVWFWVFFNIIHFRPILFIIGMQLVVAMIEKHKIFQWIAIKTLHFTKGNHRLFFYLISTLAILTSAVLEDVTVAVLFIPLVIRACRILKIRSAPFLYSITITINIGALMTPFSTAKNVLIASEFNLDLVWFIRNLGPFVIVSYVVTLVLLDLFLVKKNNPPKEKQKKLLLEIMDPEIVIVNPTMFKLNSVFFVGLLVGLLAFSGHSYLVVFIGGVAMCLLNRVHFVNVFTEIDLDVVFFFIALFLLIGTMQIVGVFDLISESLAVVDLEDLLLVALGVLVFSSLMSAMLASNPTAIFLLILLTNLYPGSVPNILIIALILGLDLGGNLLPQGGTCDLLTLNLAKKNKVRGFSYKSLFKIGGGMAIIHIIFSAGYLIFYYYFMM